MYKKNHARELIKSSSVDHRTFCNRLWSPSPLDDLDTGDREIPLLAHCLNQAMVNCQNDLKLPRWLEEHSCWAR